MVILPRQSQFFRLFGVVLICVVMSLLVSSPVRAGGARPIIPGGSSIQPEGETPIQMTAQTVTMNIRGATEADNALIKLNPDSYGYSIRPIWYPGVAEVEVDFTMKNPTSEAISMDVMFPLASALEGVGWQLMSEEIVPSIQEFQVSVDGTPLEYSVDELPNPKGADRPLLPWANFPVTFPGNEETVIHVSYTIPLQYSAMGLEMLLYYVFQTGAGWAGPIGEAEMILNLPYPASEATVTGVASGSLSLPLSSNGASSAELPSGAMFEGNQARWVWIDFEPGLDDIFAVWLLLPDKWQELENARLAVEADPQDGRAWLDLANTYHFLSWFDFRMPSVFRATYVPLGIEAYQKAAELLPDQPAPHAGLAWLKLEPYLQDKKIPPEVLQSVLEELQIAKEWEIRNPSMEKETGMARWMLSRLEGDLYYYLYNDATATAEWVGWTTAWAIKVTDASLQRTHSITPTITLTPSTKSTGEPSITVTPLLSLTSQPTPPPIIAPVVTKSAHSEQEFAIILVTSVIFLIIIAYLVWQRLRKS